MKTWIRGYNINSLRFITVGWILLHIVWTFNSASAVAMDPVNAMVFTKSINSYLFAEKYKSDPTWEQEDYFLI